MPFSAVTYLCSESVERIMQCCDLLDSAQYVVEHKGPCLGDFFDLSRDGCKFTIQLFLLPLNYHEQVLLARFLQFTALRNVCLHVVLPSECSVQQLDVIAGSTVPLFQQEAHALHDLQTVEGATLVSVAEVDECT